MNQVGPVNEWEIEEYSANFLVMGGYNEGGEQVVERNYTLDPEGTRLKIDGEWVEADRDDGGFPLDAMFTAEKKIEDTQ